LTSNIISKVLEIDNCNKDVFIEALYKPNIWEKAAPVKSMKVEFISPNVFRSEIIDEVKLTVGNLLNIPIEMTGELVLLDEGEIPQKGRLIKFNVRNNKNIKELEGRIRIKDISLNKTKIGVFVDHFTFSSDFLNLIGKNAGELILRSKITDLLRNLEKFCKKNDLKELLK